MRDRTSEADPSKATLQFPVRVFLCGPGDGRPADEQPLIRARYQIREAIEATFEGTSVILLEEVWQGGILMEEALEHAQRADIILILMGLEPRGELAELFGFVSHESLRPKMFVLSHYRMNWRNDLSYEDSVRWIEQGRTGKGITIHQYYEEPDILAGRLVVDAVAIVQYCILGKIRTVPDLG